MRRAVSYRSERTLATTNPTSTLMPEVLVAMWFALLLDARRTVARLTRKTSLQCVGTPCNNERTVS